jgi:hypothetical protein
MTTKLDMLILRDNSQCHWCGKDVKKYTLKHGQAHPHNMATVDHVYPKNDPRRAERASDPAFINHILSCHTCNMRRGNLPYSVFLVLVRVEWRDALELVA